MLQLPQKPGAWAGVFFTSNGVAPGPEQPPAEAGGAPGRRQLHPGAERSARLRRGGGVCLLLRVPCGVGNKRKPNIINIYIYTYLGGGVPCFETKPCVKTWIWAQRGVVFNLCFPSDLIPRCCREYTLFLKSQTAVGRGGRDSTFLLLLKSPLQPGTAVDRHSRFPVEDMASM